jgi:hypothetical protein
MRIAKLREHDMPSRPATLLSLCATLMLAACSGGNALSTGALLGGDSKPKEPPAPRNDPGARAFQVGAVSARAQKCGFNFDPARLKANFLAAEMQAGTSADELAKAERLYNSTQNTVAKAVSGAEDYCSGERVAYIRGDLNRHLAGDFAPSPPRSFAKDDSLFTFNGPNEGDATGIPITR